ncbi:hypothetical protein SRHO_G00162450 [Serrasalmus rhombeus]
MTVLRTEEFLAMESLKGTTRGEDVYDSVSAVMERHKLPWRALANVTTDGSPNLTGRNVGLLKRIQDRVKEDNPEQEDPETAPQELQLELIDLQCDTVLKEKFNSLKLDEFYASLSTDKFPNIRKMEQRMLVLFGSTYV